MIAHTFPEGYEVLGENRYLEASESLCRWILELPRNPTGTGFCIGYHNHDTNGTIHNSNMVGAAVLARTAKHSGNQEYLYAAKGAMKFSCFRQLADSAWLYGEAPKNYWIDNFHTGYNLDALNCYIESTGDKEYESNMKKGLEFYKANFFEENGRPKYYHNRTYPIDSQCAAQAIDTLSNFLHYDKSTLELAQRVAKWTIENMQEKKNTFTIGVSRRDQSQNPMIHWAQATTYKALTLLFLKMR